MPILTQNLLKNLINYDPKTGLTFWKERDACLFESKIQGKELIAKRWNAVNANKEIKHIDKSNGYIRITLFGKTYCLHRIIWFYMTGEWPLMIDHINGDKTNNAWRNLRKATAKINNGNRGLSKNNTSGYRGVSWNKQRQKWEAKIKVGGVNRYLGYFDDPLKAFMAYCHVARNEGFTDRHIFGDNYDL